MFKDDEISRTISTLTERGGFNALRLKVELEISQDKREDLRKIIDTVLEQAAGDALSAGYGGRWDDGGASASVAALQSFLDGILFCKVGRTTKYDGILEQARKEADPEYQKYLELKNKFEGK